jgi:diaminopimelate epimerase
MNGNLLRFYKMTGSGNDFVMLDGREHQLADWPAERIASVCARQTGVGADGVVLLTPEGADRVRMQYFNADGSFAAMCGNAALCSTRLAARLEMAPAAGMTLLTPAGEVMSRCTGAGQEAEINLPSVEALVRVDGICRPGEHQAWLGVVGVPHLIVLVDDVDRLDVVARGRQLRSDPALGPAGANVNFISPPTGPDTPWLIRTYERGVEGETLACGTGTVAAALLLVQVGRTQLPLVFASRSGSKLSVRATPTTAGGFDDVWLEAEGRFVFEGVLA